MRILNCHIENFGKIHNLSMDFSDGMHVINAPNAWGKSTLAAFIKVMFYGFDTKKEVGAFDKERNIYRPWQGGVYGGELEFEVDGQTYRISRTFGKSEKADEFHLYDCITNLECSDYSQNIGEELFDLDGASFRRSIYIAQNDCASQTTDAINAKLGNLVENTNDINNYESAQEYLKNLFNQLSPSRATGSIKKRRNQITAIEHELRSYEAAESAVEELKQKQQLALFNKESLTRQRDSYASQLKEASEESRKKELRKSYLGLCEEQEEKLSALLPYTEIFPMGVPDEKELAEKIADARKFEEDKNTLSHMELNEEERNLYVKLQVKFRRAVPQVEEIETRQEQLKQIQNIKDERMRVEMKISEKEHESLQMKEPSIENLPKVSLWMILGAVFVLAGIAGEIFGIVNVRTPIVGWACIAGGMLVFLVGIVSLILGVRKRSNGLKSFELTRKEWEEDRQTWKAEVTKLQEQERDKTNQIQSIYHSTEEYLRQFLIYANESEYLNCLFELKSQVHEYENLCEKIDRFEAFKETVWEEKAALDAYIRKIGQRAGEDITAKLNYLATEAAKYRMAKDNANAAQERVKVFEQQYDMSSILREHRMSFSLEQLNEKIKRLDDELEDVRAGIEQYARQMEDLEEQLDLRDEKTQELEELMALQEKEQKIFDTVSVTQDYLQRAKEQFTARYMAPISNAFRKYYNMLIGISEENAWQIDANISFSIREQGELRETKWLSAGYQDLIGVCMRLALADAMYQGEKPFLILDDPFVNLDEEKTKRGMQLLMKVAEDYQVLYFTCHGSRAPQNS